MDLQLTVIRARSDAGERARGADGFTFLEIMIVMAVMAMLLGLGIGFLASAGRATMTQQAVEIVAESGRLCLNRSAGGRRAILEIRTVEVDASKRLEVRTATQQIVLTANFEPTGSDKPDADWFINANEPSSAKVTGTARIDPDGKAGGAAVLTPGATIDYGTRSAFAMTDGLELSCWVRPDSTGRRMTLMKAESGGQTLWQVDLTQGAGRIASFDVELAVQSVAANVTESVVGARETFHSTGGALRAGVWSEVRVTWDGRDASILVNGVESLKVDKVRAGATTVRKAGRLATPSSGAVRLVTGANFTGAIDTLTVAGIFRSDEDVRRLPFGVELFRTKEPVRIVFFNGRLDPTVHSRDVEVRLKGPSDDDATGAMIIRFGLYGSIPPPAYHVGDVGPDPEAMR